MSLLTDPNERIGRDISRRILVRERSRLQTRFLDRLRELPCYPFLTLTGGAALHGAYLHGRWSDALEFEAPTVVAKRFMSMSEALGPSLQQKEDHFVFTERIAVAREVRITVAVVPRRALPPPPEERRFVDASGRSVLARVSPVKEIVRGMVADLRVKPRAVDLLDIWLYARSGEEAAKRLILLGEGRPLALSSEQRREMERAWSPDSELRESMAGLPNWTDVLYDLTAIHFLGKS